MAVFPNICRKMGRKFSEHHSAIALRYLKDHFTPLVCSGDVVGPNGVNLRNFLCGVPKYASKYASALFLDSLDLGKNISFPDWTLFVSPFPRRVKHRYSYRDSLRSLLGRFYLRADIIGLSR